MKTAVATFELRKFSLLKDLISVIGSGLFIAWIGSVTISLPFTPIPLSLRLQAILLLSYLLGSKRAVAATAFFLSLGAFGLSIFANHTFGIAAIIGPSGGYILGYLFASLVVGYMKDCNKSATKAFLAGLIIVFFFGIFHLTYFFGFEKALQYGLYPFIFSDLLKTLLIIRLAKFTA